MISVCMRGSNASYRPLPSAFARYIARSASRRSVSASSLPTAMPMLAFTNTSRSDSENGSVSASSTRSAARAASPGSGTSSSSTANSSPPRRAIVSEGRSRFASRPAI